MQEPDAAVSTPTGRTPAGSQADREARGDRAGQAGRGAARTPGSTQNRRHRGKPGAGARGRSRLRPR